MGGVAADAIPATRQAVDAVIVVITLRILPPLNGPKLTGADPHAVKYSVREVARRGAASGAAWSWAALLTIDQRRENAAPGEEPGYVQPTIPGRSPRKPSLTMTRANMPHAMPGPADQPARQKDEPSEKYRERARAEGGRYNGDRAAQRSKLTGFEPHAKWQRTRDEATRGSKSGAATSWTARNVASRADLAEQFPLLCLELRLRQFASLLTRLIDKIRSDITS